MRPYILHWMFRISVMLLVITVKVIVTSAFPLREQARNMGFVIKGGQLQIVENITEMDTVPKTKKFSWPKA